MGNKIENKYGNVIVFETTDYKWGVKDINGNEIVSCWEVRLDRWL